MKTNKVVMILILVLGFVLSMSMIMPSGSQYCFNNLCGVFFWGAHEHDSVWHLAVINNLFHHFPFEMPNMSKVTIAGYNYLMDIVIATLAKLTWISSSTLYFKILPPLWFGLMSYLSIKFATTYHKKSSTYPALVLFFVFFGSSFSYVLNLHRLGSIWGSSSVLSMQSAQAMLNPQFAWSLIPILLVLIGLNQGKRKMQNYWLYGVYAMIAMGLKFYTGTALLIIIATDLVIELLKKKKIVLSMLIGPMMVALMCLLSIIIFYSPGKSGGFPFSFKPWATVNPIIEDQSLFYLSNWAQRLYEYRGIRLAMLEIVVLIIFTVLNFGSRIFGIVANIGRSPAERPTNEPLLAVTAGVTFLMSILLVQRGVWWNTVQFLYVSLFLSGLIAASGLDNLLTKYRRMGISLIIVTVLLTIPNNLDLARSFIHVPGTGYITQVEMAALTQLKTLPAGVILSPIFEPRAQRGSIGELPRKYDTGYISAYTGKQTYLADLIQLQLTNIEYLDRKTELSSFDCKILGEVKYIYEYKDSEYASQFDRCGVSIKRIIDNEAVSVYQVN